VQRFYDAINNRLVYVDQGASEDFWDSHWQTEDFYKAVTATPNSWVSRITRKYLDMESSILEGGCDSGNHVYALQHNDFNAVGLDFASKTVGMIKKSVPELNVQLGDVRSLPFEDDLFDGYWSLGVIEHFWNGYEDIALEMKRVLRKGGYLFLTFPTMSSLRQWKAKEGKYPLWKNNEEPEGFYQFALDSEKTKQYFVNLGFEVIRQKNLDGIKGLKDEVSLISRPLQKLYDSSSFVSKVVRKILDFISVSFSGHSQLLILRKL